MVNKAMKTIMVSISRGSLIRNFFHTGIIGNLLLSGVRVVVLTPNYKEKWLFEEYKHKNLFIDSLPEPTVRFARLIRELYKGLVFNRTVFIRYRYRMAGKPPKKIFFIPRLLFLAPLRFIPGLKNIFRYVESLINSQHEYDELLKKYKPDLVFSTALGSCDADSGLLKCAKRLYIKTVCMPKSWDNLSKGLFGVKTDSIIVWSDFMREQAKKFQGYSDDEISVTGVPQFDFYSKKELLASREVFCEKFGFDPNKKIILYGSTGGECVDEQKYLDIIKIAFDKALLRNAQVLVRPHIGYLDDGLRFIKSESYDNFVVDDSDKQNNIFKDRWDPSFGHVVNLYNSLHHADVVINVASTLTLDSLVCGTEVVNIKFDPKGVNDQNYSVKRLYESDYIDAIVKSECSWVAEDECMFISMIQKILNGEKRNSENVLKAINYFVNDDSGRASENIFKHLLSLIKQE